MAASGRRVIAARDSPMSRDSIIRLVAEIDRRLSPPPTTR